MNTEVEEEDLAGEEDTKEATLDKETNTRIEETMGTEKEKERKGREKSLPRIKEVM